MKAAPFPRLFHRSPGGFGWGNMKDVDIHCMFPRSPVFPRIFMGGGLKMKMCSDGGRR